MARMAFVMELNPGLAAKYKQIHDEIWPEMVDALHGFGIRNYSIFLHGQTLFAYLECDDVAALSHQRENPVIQRWWKMMEPYMKYNDDGTPWSLPIPEVFHMD